MTAPVAGHCFPPQKLPPELPPNGSLQGSIAQHGAHGRQRKAREK
jgi:hypothetical protein